ncbi:MAG: DUF4215 domain-containing protein [Myxococcales bacterium]|nr:DUF4215 domain-containing protein [Myxococcales bacterium]MCB9568149.1 DUF4215 domain-containing protein [Myxococcales bacterium]MCB9705376.1 DUF4215 domain-containing protein [Myxococcales bacterium]
MPNVRELHRLSAALLSACLLPGCVLTNPAFDGESSGTGGGSQGSSTSGLGSTSSTSAATTGGGASAATETGGAEGSSGGASTTGVEPACGDLVLDPGEECDDGNTLNDDGCLSSCLIPRTCAEILKHDPDAASGTYKIDPQGKGAPWPVVCDMELDGGGWTGIAVGDTCNGNLSSTLTAFEGKEGTDAGITEACQPFAVNINGGNYHYFFDVDFPPSFKAFFLRDYTLFTISDPELGFEQTSWGVGTQFPEGSFSLGDAYAEGPVANWFKDGGPKGPLPKDMEVAYPLLDAPFVLAQPSDKLRLAWADTTTVDYDDGLYPWWAGRIFVR